MKNGTTECWMSPFSQMFTIQEATPEQHRWIDEDLRDLDHGWVSVTPEQAAARRKYIREDLASVRPDSKVLVMTPRRCPTSIDEIYCTVSLHRRDILLAGGNKAPRLISGFVVYGVVVPAAIRMSGYATAMMRRLLGDKNVADPNEVFEEGLRKWLCVDEPEVFFSGWFDQGGVAAHLWNKFGASTLGFKITVTCDRASELKPDATLMDSHRALSMDETIKAIEHHNELIKREWFEKYDAEPYGEHLTTQMLAPLEDTICRFRWREWAAHDQGTVCPKTWGFELHERGHKDWAYIAFVHGLQEKNLHVISYHARTTAALRALLYLTCTAQDIVGAYNPSHILIRLARAEEFHELLDTSVVTKSVRSVHHVAMVKGYKPDVSVTDIGPRLHEQDVRYC